MKYNEQPSGMEYLHALCWLEIHATYNEATGYWHFKMPYGSARDRRVQRPPMYVGYRDRNGQMVVDVEFPEAWNGPKQFVIAHLNYIFTTRGTASAPFNTIKHLDGDVTNDCHQNLLAAA